MDLLPSFPTRWTFFPEDRGIRRKRQVVRDTQFARPTFRKFSLSSAYEETIQHHPAHPSDENTCFRRSFPKEKRTNKNEVGTHLFFVVVIEQEVRGASQSRAARHVPLSFSLLRSCSSNRCATRETRSAPRAGESTSRCRTDGENVNPSLRSFDPRLPTWRLPTRKRERDEERILRPAKSALACFHCSRSEVRTTCSSWRAVALSLSLVIQDGLRWRRQRDGHEENATRWNGIPSPPRR